MKLDLGWFYISIGKDGFYVELGSLSRAFLTFALTLDLGEP